MQKDSGMKNIKSVESEKEGMGLRGKVDAFKINIEVKGQSGAELNVELTPNEFKAFNKCSKNYHLLLLMMYSLAIQQLEFLNIKKKVNFGLVMISPV